MSYATNTGYSQDVTNQIVASIMDSYHGNIGGKFWGTKNITFSFDKSATTIKDALNAAGATFVEVDQTTKTYTREVFQDVAAYCGLTFTEVASGGGIAIVFEPSRGNSVASASSYGGSMDVLNSSIVMLGQGYTMGFDNDWPAKYVNAYSTLAHEIMHALGYSHPFDGPGPVLAEAYSNTANTVVAYSGNYSNGLRPADILALQQAYGANPNAPDGLPICDSGIAAGQISLSWYTDQTNGHMFEVTPYVGGTTDWHYAGTDGNDVITQPFRYSSIYGGNGIDTVVVGGTRGDCMLVGTTLTQGNTSIALSGVERIQFNDWTVSIGTRGTLGSVIKVLAAALGPSALTPEVIGACMKGYVPEGSDLLQTCQVAVNYLNLDNASFVTRVYQNVTGSTPDTATRDAFVGQIADGTYTQASLLDVAGNYAAAHVAVVGSMLAGSVEWV